MKILFCDDEVMLLQIYKDELEDTFDDVEVLIAQNGKEGLEVFMEHRPTYVFTDGKMPGMDGLELAEKLQEFNGPPTTFLITGYAGTYDEEKIKEKGITDIFYKPVDYSDLIEFIAKLPRP